MSPLSQFDVLIIYQTQLMCCLFIFLLSMLSIFSILTSNLIPLPRAFSVIKFNFIYMFLNFSNVSLVVAPLFFFNNNYLRVIKRTKSIVLSVIGGVATVYHLTVVKLGKLCARPSPTWAAAIAVIPLNSAFIFSHFCTFSLFQFLGICLGFFLFFIYQILIYGYEDSLFF